MKCLITGGTGSLGRALTTRLYGKADITIFSRDETKQGLMRREFPDCRYILGDVAELKELERAFTDQEIIFHFAAYKVVPSAQNNVAAAIKTNVTGSQNVIDAAITSGVRQVVASSTDKSCASINAYGASKYLMECLFQDANKYERTTFHLARYGNVIGSNASVIPMFQQQANKGGPLTVTNKEMTRFWITIQTAVDLILKALKAEPGVIVVPKAKALGIMDVARIVGNGLPIVETQIRAGEKIHEAMVNLTESFHTKEYEEVFHIYPPTGQLLNSIPFEYTSDKAEQLTDEELLEMMETMP